MAGAKRSSPSAAATAPSRSKRARGGGGSGGVSKPAAKPPPPAVTDARFAALHWDPRFSRVPKHASKVPVDERFKGELLANPAFRGSAARVDRFGRVREEGKGGGDALERIYDVGGSSAGESEGESADGDGESESGSGSESEGEGGIVDGGNGVGVQEESGEEVEEAKGEGEDAPEVIARGAATRRLAVMGLDWSNTRALDIFASLQSFCPPGKLLKDVKVYLSKFGMERLEQEAQLGPAVLSKIDAAVLEKRKVAAGGNGAGGGGEEKEESEEGDGSGEDSGGDESGSEDSEESESDSEDEEDGDGAVMPNVFDGTRRDQDEQDALRKYEEDRLKYYYAVAEFEDISAADAVYEQCDGVEFESTGLAMDLRFVPDAMEIDAPLRDAASSIPDGYAPPNLAPSTLNNCKVKLSWDADAPDRAVLKKRAFGKHEEDEANLKAYLASASESEDGEDGEAGEAGKEIDRKRALLLGGLADGDGGGVDDEDMEMEVTFEPGLAEKGEEIVKRKQEREEKKDESHWEARLRRMQERKAEKRKVRKEQIKRAMGNEEEEDGDASGGQSDDSMYGDVVDNPRFANDPFFNADVSDEEEGDTGAPKQPKQAAVKAKRGGKPGKNVKDTGHSGKEVGDDLGDAEEARRVANLELIMMDDDRKQKKSGSTLRDRLLAADSDDDDSKAKKGGRGGKTGRSRGRRRSDREAAAAAAAESAQATAMDVSDERFSGLFSSHMFAMDPTHPKFKRNATTDKILKEKSRRGGSTAPAALPARRDPSQGTEGLDAGDKRDNRPGATADVPVPRDDVMKLAASIKARSSTKRRERH